MRVVALVQPSIMALAASALAGAAVALQSAARADARRTAPPGPSLPSAAARRPSGSVTSSAAVDAEIRRLVDLGFRDFIETWYPTVTDHLELRSTLRALLEDIVAAVDRRLQGVDLVEVMYKDVVHAMIEHMDTYRHCVDIVGTAYANGLDVEELYLRAMPHPALQDTEHEREYLRQIVAWIVHILLPESERNSDLISTFMREALAHAVLGHVFDMAAEPDFLNHALYLVRTRPATGAANAPWLSRSHTRSCRPCDSACDPGVRGTLSGPDAQ